jgi:hypothetical protein
MKHKAILIWLIVLISIFGCRIEKTDVTGTLEDDQDQIPPLKAQTNRASEDILKWHPPLATDVFYAQFAEDNPQLAELAPMPITRTPVQPILMQPALLESLSFIIDYSTLKPYIPEHRETGLEPALGIPVVSKDRLITATFNNDVMLHLDYYYTNGLRIDYIDPALVKSPFGYLMLPYRNHSVNYHGISVVQDIYTPIVLDTAAIQYGDRPFAGVFYVGQFKVALDPVKKLKQVSEVNFGVLGPNSLGGFVQTSIHETKPTGWVNQINNDVIFNYNVRFEKGLVNNQKLDFNAIIQGKAGTLHTNIGAGFYTRIGRFMPYFNNIGLISPGRDGYTSASKIQYALSLSSILRFVAYDATLQGGMFSRDNIYTLSPEEISRLVFNAGLGIEFSYKFVGFQAKMNYITPEFKSGKQHFWIHMAATFCF